MKISFFQLPEAVGLLPTAYMWEEVSDALLNGMVC